MRSFSRIIMSGVLCAAAVCAEHPARASGPPWIRDFNDGQQKARQENKDLLVVFTGHGWCASCEVLDREIFQKPDFVREAAKSFVFVELDFTFGGSEQEKQRQRAYRELQKRYLAPTVPAIYLLDPQGVPYAIFGDYKAGTGPRKMLALIAEARAARAERDRNFAAARKAAGLERAELLHSGLQAVAPLLGSLEDRGDDPILSFYATDVAEIRKLDSGEKGRLKEVYEARQQQRDDWKTVQDSTIGKIREFDNKKDYKGAIAFIDAALKQFLPADIHWRLEVARQIHFEWDGQYAAGLANARRLLAEPDRPPADREYLLGRESYNLFNSGRVEEGVAQFDRRIREVHGSPENRLRLLHNKADMMSNRPGISRAQMIQAWRDFRDAAKPKTDDWYLATWQLALQLKRGSDPRGALALQREFLQADPTSLGMRLDAAESHIALGENDAARKLIREVEQGLPLNPERQDEKESKEWLRTRIARLQQRLAKPPK